MVAKISIGTSLFGALAYNGEKVNKKEGKLLDSNGLFDECTGKVDTARLMGVFERYLAVNRRTEKPVIHISLNPHPDDKLTDDELKEIAREYMEKMGYGEQPYLIYKHEDIDRHHIHIVSVRTDKEGKCLNNAYNFHRSKAITRELEKKYGLHTAERQTDRLESPLQKVEVVAGNVKKQVGNVIKALNKQYRFQTIGEYRVLLSLFNVTVEETQGNIRGREYHGLVYSATDNNGEKIGNPFKASLFGKEVGYEALLKKFARSKQEIKDKQLAIKTKRTLLSVMGKTYHKVRFISELKQQGIDSVFRYTEERRIYGATFIDHRTGCVLNGSRMSKELSANALQEHFTLPYSGLPSVQLSIPNEEKETVREYTTLDNETPTGGGIGLFTSEGPAINAEEEAFIRAMKRKKRKKRKGFGI